MLSFFRSGGVGNVVVAGVAFAIIVVFALEFRTGRTGPSAKLSRECAVAFAGNCVDPKEYYAAHGIMYDYPYVAQRTFDVLRLVEWLKAHGHTEIHLVAKGWGAIPAALGAVLAENITQVTLKHALTSYGDIVTAEEVGFAPHFLFAALAFRLGRLAGFGLLFEFLAQRLERGEVLDRCHVAVRIRFVA